MNVVFRVDASLHIGSGHVMRCLVLADALKKHGAHCHFACRDTPGHMAGRILRHGHQLVPMLMGGPEAHVGTEADSEWRGQYWASDADQTRAAMPADVADWLVVDHYALDERWERAMAGTYRRLLVIDDLADRPHIGEMLLDPSFRRNASEYSALVPSHCTLMVGSEFALIRPEFPRLRGYSLQRRTPPVLRKLLVSMGGMDRTDATGRVLSALGGIAMPIGFAATIVMGSAAPAVDSVRSLAATLPWPANVEVDVEDMAQLVADADLVLGAGGGSAWERCCLGVPAIVLVLADNQRHVAAALDASGAAVAIEDGDGMASSVVREITRLAADPMALAAMGREASKVTDGLAVEPLVALMEARRV